MTVSLERIFLVYILKNKKYIENVLPYYFRNPDIEYVYSIVRKWMVENTSEDTPTPKQISEMVFLEDRDNRITPNILKSMLKVDLSEYNEDNFIKPKLTAWIIINRVKNLTSNVIDESRELDNVSDLDGAMEVANRIKVMTEESTVINFGDEDLGDDFDDPDSHTQDHTELKIQSGWDCLDYVLGGGWDRSTMSVLLGETNGGKSLWMQNIAINAANKGYNVVYFTLEMSTKKIFKRMGSMRLRIPIDRYDEVSLDTEQMKRKIENLKNMAGNSLFDNKVGKIISKFYPAGTSTITDFDSFLKNIKEKKGFVPDMVIVDYITLMAPVKGLGIESNLFLKGKHLAEGLRAIAAKHEIALVTATQVSKDAWGANDITLDKIPESKAIAETADTMFAIIRNEDMKRQNMYRLKLLKQRDGDFSRSQIKFNLNPEFLTIEDDQFVDTY